MQRFKSLKDIVLHLNKEQFDIAFKFLDFPTERPTGKKIISLIKKYPTIVGTNVSKRLKIKPESLDRTCGRIREAVLESLLLDTGLEHLQVSDGFKGRIRARKDFLIAFSIWSLSKETTRLFDRIESIGKQYECYDQLVEMYIWRQGSESRKHGMRAFNKYQKLIDHYERCRDGSNRAIRYWHQHFAENVDRKGLHNEKVSLLTEALALLQEDYEATNASVLGYYMYMLQMEYNLVQKDYEQLKQAGQKALNLVKTRIAITKPNHFGMVINDLSDAALIFGDYEEALQRAYESRKLFPSNLYNYAITLITELLCKIYTGEYKEAHAILREVSTDKNLRGHGFMENKLQFYFAYLLFLESKPNDALKRLGKIKEVDQDKEGFNIALRILQIQALIELDRKEVADDYIESLRIYLLRHKSKYLRKRDLIISRILRRLSAKSYNFKLVVKLYAKQFEQLNQNAWQAKTPELYPFEKWFTDFSGVKLTVEDKEQFEAKN